MVIEFSTAAGHTLWRLPVATLEEADRVLNGIAAKIQDLLDQEEVHWTESGQWIKGQLHGNETVLVFDDPARFGDAERTERAANGA